MLVNTSAKSSRKTVSSLYPHKGPAFGVENHIRLCCKLLQTVSARFLDLHAYTSIGKVLSEILDAAKGHIWYSALEAVRT
jgi:hypothetical protein